MLAAHSAVFRAMFSHTNTKETASGVIEIKEAAAMRTLVCFCNSGRVEQLDETLAVELLVLADRYQMPKLLVCATEIKIGGIPAHIACRSSAHHNLARSRRVKTFFACSR